MARKRPSRAVRLADAERRRLEKEREAYALDHDKRIAGLVPVAGMFRAFENPRRASGKEQSTKWGWSGNIAKVVNRSGGSYQ